MFIECPWCKTVISDSSSTCVTCGATICEGKLVEEGRPEMKDAAANSERTYVKAPRTAAELLALAKQLESGAITSERFKELKEAYLNAGVDFSCM